MFGNPKVCGAHLDVDIPLSLFIFSFLFISWFSSFSNINNKKRRSEIIQLVQVICEAKGRVFHGFF